MAFQKLDCPDCGAKVEVDDINAFGFCSYCGTKIMLKDIIEIRHKGQSSTELHMSAMQEIEQIMAHFAPVKKYYNTIENNNHILATMKEDDYAKYLFIAGGISLAIGILFFADIPLFGILMILIGSGALTGGFYVKNLAKNKRDDLKLSNTISQRKIDDNYNEYFHCPLGQEFTRPNVLAIIYNYIRQGRAESIKEALNLYISESRSIDIKIHR